MVLGLLLHGAEHWATQHMPGWLWSLSTLMSPGQYPILDVGILLPVPTAGVGCHGVSSHLLPRQGLSLLQGWFLLVGRDRLSPVLGREEGAPSDPSVKAEGRKGQVSKRWAQERQAGLADH